MIVMGVESSCDETGVGIVDWDPESRTATLLADEVASSQEEHARYGGVVPEVASRAHLQAMVPTLRRALEAADVDASEVDGICVTAGPGLMGALVVGLSAAKASLATSQHALRVYFQRVWESPDPEYRIYSQRLTTHACQGFASIHASTSPAQRANAVKVLKAYEADLRSLAGSR